MGACLILAYRIRRGTSTENIKVIVEHPNGERPHVATLTTEKEEHRVEADRGEGGFTYKVCFTSSQPKGRSTRVEVRDERVFLHCVSERPISFLCSLVLVFIFDNYEKRDMHVVS